MKCLFFPFAILFVFSVSAPAASETANLRVATFQCDVTPPIGHWLYAHPLKTVEHPLLAKGTVLEQAGTRYVLCAIDWCVLSNESHARFRGAMAEAAYEPGAAAVARGSEEILKNTIRQLLGLE